VTLAADTAWIDPIVATAQVPEWCSDRPGLGRLLSAGSRLGVHILIAQAEALSHAPSGTSVNEIDGIGRSEYAPTYWAHLCDYSTVADLAVAADRIVTRMHDNDRPLARTPGDDLLVRWMIIIAGRAADYAGIDAWFADADARTGIDWGEIELELRQEMGRRQWLADITEALLEQRQPHRVDFVTRDPGPAHPYHPTRWFDRWPADNNPRTDP